MTSVYSTTPWPCCGSGRPLGRSGLGIRRDTTPAAPEDADTEPVPLDMPDPAGIDYYARLRPPASRTVEEGNTVICGFRVQAFVTRACVVGVTGAGTSAPAVAGAWNSLGDPIPEREE